MQGIEARAGGAPHTPPNPFMPSGARSALYRGTRATATALVQQRHLPRGIDRLQATADGELRVDVLQVKLDGVFGDENTARYFLVRNAVGEIDEDRSEEHTSELQSLMSISYAVFCL